MQSSVSGARLISRAACSASESRRPAIAHETKAHWTKVHYRADSFGPSVGYDRYVPD
jgi:hypothetical protein